jgi:hypothetical protein
MKGRKKTIDYSVSEEGNVSRVKNVVRNGKLVKNVTKTYGNTDNRKTVERSRLVGNKAISFGRTTFTNPDGKKTKIKTAAVISPSRSISVGVKNTGGVKENFVKRTNNSNNSQFLRTKSGSEKPVYKVSGATSKTSIGGTSNARYARQMFKADESISKRKK